MELIHLQNRVSHTYISSTLLKRSNLKTLQSKIKMVKNSCACLRENSQIVSTSTFDQCELIRKLFWQKCVQCARKGKKCSFSHTVHIFVKIIYFLNTHWLKVPNKTIWDFSLKHEHVCFTILILDCKVLKFERSSSVTWNVSVKQAILKVN